MLLDELRDRFKVANDEKRKKSLATQKQVSEWLSDVSKHDLFFEWLEGHFRELADMGYLSTSFYTLSPSDINLRKELSYQFMFAASEKEEIKPSNLVGLGRRIYLKVREMGLSVSIMSSSENGCERHFLVASWQ